MLRYTATGSQTTVELDLDAPIVEIVDALFEAGLPSNRAEDEALRLVADEFWYGPVWTVHIDPRDRHATAVEGLDRRVFRNRVSRFVHATDETDAIRVARQNARKAAEADARSR